MRRSKFKDARLRRAFNFAFDFERINNEIFYGQYKRIASYFDGTELAASGLPVGRELEILETVRAEVPREVFVMPYWNPVARNANAFRNNLLEARRLLEAAGFNVRDLKRVDTRTGQPLTVEFLIADPSLERFVLPYKELLARLGIDATVLAVDAIQYENRLRQWDFDIVVESWTESSSPGKEQRDYWGSQAAITPGSRNTVGIANPAVDSLIDRILFAKDRNELVAATRALDRVLLWNYYVVPQWTYGQGPHCQMGSLRETGAHADLRPIRLSRDLVVGRQTCRRLPIVIELRAANSAWSHPGGQGKLVRSGWHRRRSCCISFR